MEIEYEPKGVKFYDAASKRVLLLVKEGWAEGWLCYKHPDGQWVTVREATEKEIGSVISDPALGKDKSP